MLRSFPWVAGFPPMVEFIKIGKIQILESSNSKGYYSARTDVL